MLNYMNIPLDEIKSSMRLQDYINMDIVNRTWSEQLFHITKLYESLRCSILGMDTRIVDIVREFQGNITDELCVLDIIASVRNAIRNFTIWEKQTYFVNFSHSGPANLSDRNEDFQIRLAHDIIREYGQFEEFTDSLRQHLEIIGNSIDNLQTCNMAEMQELVKDLESTLQWLNGVMAEMAALLHELKRSALPNDLMLSINSHYSTTPVEYVR